MVSQLAEVTPPEAVGNGAVELGGAADEIVPGAETLRGLTVVQVSSEMWRLSMNTSPADQFCGSRLSQSPRSSSRMRFPEGARRFTRVPPRTAADDDDVVVHHPNSSSRSASTILAAASIRARCENACGKLPRCRPVLVSNSSAYSPVERQRPRGAPSGPGRAAGRRRLPARTRAQNEQIRKLPPCPTGRRPSRRSDSGVRIRPP